MDRPCPEQLGLLPFAAFGSYSGVETSCGEAGDPAASATDARKVDAEVVVLSGSSAFCS